MTPALLLGLSAAFLAYALVAKRLDSLPLTGPMLFLGLGIALGPTGFGLATLSVGDSALHTLVELTLVLVLFADAATVRLRRRRAELRLPIRMLVLGLPLTLLLGAAISIWMFPDLNVWEAALLAAILTPTDAALGQAVVTQTAVPKRIRQAIVVESGLNDGLMLPLVLLFASLAAMHGSESPAQWAVFLGQQLGLGPLVGIAVGWAGARAVLAADARGWMGDGGQGLASLALAALAYGGAEAVHGNGFVSAFVAGLTFGAQLKGRCEFLLEFQETEAKILVLLAFLVVGLVLVPAGLPSLTGVCIVFGLLSLTVQRMVPVALSLVGTGTRIPTRLFLGWFGPRGLASVLFLLLVLEEFEPAGGQRILTVVMSTVVLSVLLHGLTAAPLAHWYARRVNNAHAESSD